MVEEIVLIGNVQKEIIVYPKSGVARVGSGVFIFIIVGIGQMKY